MFTQLREATILSALLFAGFANADDTIRLDGRSESTQRLELKASDSNQDVTEQTCWIRGGSTYSSYYYGPPVTYYRAPVYYYPPAVGFYAPPVRVYRPMVYYRVPRVVYYPRPLVSYPAIRVQAQSVEPEPQSFNYDGGQSKPIQKIPPARLDTPANNPNLPKLPSVPKLGPAPGELKVSEPSAGSKKNRSYLAYGEDQPSARDDKALLIRAGK